MLSKIDFQALQKLDTCTVANAIDRLKVRPRNEGSMLGSAVRCQLPNLGPMLGYAATGRLRSIAAPIAGRTYRENLNWWRYIASIPEPRIMVLQDADNTPGAGALLGELHALIGLALNCVGYVTNGSVRDLPAVEALGFHLFAGSVAVSHMYAHVSEYGEPIEIGRMRIESGDLLHGDCHGVHSIPLSIASKIPAVVTQMLSEERGLKDFCRSPDFSLEGLGRRLETRPADGADLPPAG